MSISKQDIKDLRGDLSPFLIHLTRNGNFRRWADIHNLKRDDFEMMDAKKSLELILENNKIEARSPLGYFNYKVSSIVGRNKKSMPICGSSRSSQE